MCHDITSHHDAHDDTMFTMDPWRRFHRVHRIIVSIVNRPSGSFRLFLVYEIASSGPSVPPIAHELHAL